MSETSISKRPLRTVRHLAPLMLAAVVSTMTLLHPTENLAAQPERASEIIAAQLRRQGVVCTAPRDVSRDHSASSAHRAVWAVVCDEAAYRVELAPRASARVSRVLD
ncbi:MAG TPA: hypothetical protein VEA77_03330 [Hyphomicrobium sp.]|nr:hypothetical protein [Hyphomicrobium sp.]